MEKKTAKASMREGRRERCIFIIAARGPRDFTSLIIATKISNCCNFLFCADRGGYTECIPRMSLGRCRVFEKRKRGLIRTRNKFE